MIQDWLFNNQNVLNVWTLGHLLVGILFGMIFSLKNIKFKISFPSTLLLLLIWEIYEKLFTLSYESLVNSIFDIFVTLLFFILTIKYISKHKKRIHKIKFTRHKEAFDLWTLIHLTIWGIVSSFIIILGISNSLFFPFLISLFIMIIWEIYEKYEKVGESFINSFFDVLFGVLGFLIFALLQSKLMLDNQIGVLSILVLITCALYLLGRYNKN